MPAKKYINNAPDKKDGTGKWLRSYTEELYTKSLTRSGQLWVNMETRCGEKYQTTYPSYVGVENGFSGYQDFAEWCQVQDGYLNKDGKRFWQLDKDLLVPGNRVYSKETCMFVPNDVNTLFNDSQDNGLKLGVGVYSYDSSRFVATCRSVGNKGYLGIFETEDAAHEAWRVEKTRHAMMLVDKYQDYPKVVEGIQNKLQQLLCSK
jgi:hypothetical protein